MSEKLVNKSNLTNGGDTFDLTNGNSFETLEEYATMVGETADSYIAGMDTDGDGVVSKEEFIDNRSEKSSELNDVLETKQEIEKSASEKYDSTPNFGKQDFIISHFALELDWNPQLKAVKKCYADEIKSKSAYAKGTYAKLYASLLKGVKEKYSALYDSLAKKWEA